MSEAAAAIPFPSVPGLPLGDPWNITDIPRRNLILRGLSAACSLLRDSQELADREMARELDEVLNELGGGA